MTFSLCIDSRYTSGSKLLASIIGKYNVYENFTYDMNSQLYDVCVTPTMLYGAEVFRYHLVIIWTKKSIFHGGGGGSTPYSNSSHDGRYGMDWYIY